MLFSRFLPATVTPSHHCVQYRGQHVLGRWAEDDVYRAHEKMEDHFQWTHEVRDYNENEKNSFIYLLYLVASQRPV